MVTFEVRNTIFIQLILHSPIISLVHLNTNRLKTFLLVQNHPDDENSPSLRGLTRAGPKTLSLQFGFSENQNAGTGLARGFSNRSENYAELPIREQIGCRAAAKFDDGGLL